MGTLYLVATPIGNLEDMSPRAIRILREAVLIAAEDTRHTGKLLKYFDISTPATSYFEHNKMAKIETVLEALDNGDVALVSDAGTPALNDPGYELVRAALEVGYPVSPIPGPSAPVAALVASGLPTDSFLYLGYLPRKTSERQSHLRKVENLPFTLIFLESPYRIVEALEDILATLGDRRIAVAREMTKMFEEIWRGTVKAALEYFRTQPARGEFTLVVAGFQPGDSARWSEAQVRSAIQAGLAQGDSASSLARQIARESGWVKRDVYRLINE